MSGECRTMTDMTLLPKNVSLGEALPQSMSAKSYSGKFQVRIPPERHKALAMQAAGQGISFNRYVTDKLCA